MRDETVSLLIFDPSGYSSDGKAIAFDRDEAARAWAAKYLSAFRNHRVFLVRGAAERIEPPPADEKRGGSSSP